MKLPNGNKAIISRDKLSMFEELDTVVLKSDIKKYGLKRGDVWTVVHKYDSGKVLEVEFIAAAGKTIAVVTLTPDDIRTMVRNEILHVRDFATATL